MTIESQKTQAKLCTNPFFWLFLKLSTQIAFLSLAIGIDLSQTAHYRVPAAIIKCAAQQRRNANANNNKNTNRLATLTHKQARMALPLLRY